MKNVTWKLVPDPFLIFEESSVKRNLRRPAYMLIWTNFDNFPISLLCLQIIKNNLYWKMKFLKQSAYIRY